MTVPTQYPIQVFTGTDSLSSYQTTVTARRPEDILLEVVRITDGTRIKLILNTDYTLRQLSTGWAIGILDVDSTPPKDYLIGGNGTNANLTRFYRLVIRRVVTIDQQTSIRNQGEFFAEVHEDVFDKLTEIDQQQQHDLDATVKVINPETGAAAGGTIPVVPNSVIHFDAEGNPEALPTGGDSNVQLRVDLDAEEAARLAAESAASDDRTATRRRVAQNEDDIGVLETNVGANTSAISLNRSIRGDTTDTTTASTNGTIIQRINHNRQLGEALSTTKLDVSVFTIRLYRITESGPIPDLVTFGANAPFERMYVAPQLGPSNTLLTSLEGIFHSVFIPVRETTLVESINNPSHHIQAIDVEFHATRTTTLPDTSFIGGLSCTPVNWSNKSFRITDIAEVKVPSSTFIRETIVNPALNIHNQDSNAHPALSLKIANNRDDLGFKSQDSKGETVYDALSAFSRIRLLRESAGSGGGGGGSTSSFLRVVSINDGVSVFDSEETIPDTMAVVVQTDTTIHTPLSISIQGHTTTIQAVADGNAANAISSGIRVVLTFPLGSSLKTALRNVANSNRGTIIFYINGSKTSGGSAEMVATFAIQIRRSLVQMFGTNNLTDILTRGLPLFMRNMFNTVLSNMTQTYKSHPLRSYTGWGGVGQNTFAFTNGVNASNVLSEEDWEIFLKGETMVIGLTRTAQSPVTLATELGERTITIQYGPALRAGIANRQPLVGVSGIYAEENARENNEQVQRIELFINTATSGSSARMVTLSLFNLGTTNTPGLVAFLTGLTISYPTYSFELPRSVDTGGYRTSGNIPLLATSYSLVSTRIPNYPASVPTGFFTIEHRSSDTTSILQNNLFEIAPYDSGRSARPLAWRLTEAADVAVHLEVARTPPVGFPTGARWTLYVPRTRASITLESVDGASKSGNFTGLQRDDYILLLVSRASPGETLNYNASFNIQLTGTEDSPLAVPGLTPPPA